jgi:hypothetical protein
LHCNETPEKAAFSALRVVPELRQAIRRRRLQDAGWP